MKQDTRGPADLEYQIEYLTNQNDFLKRSNKKLVEKNKLLEEEFDRLLEENNNFRLVRNEGKVL
jgi:cell division protein FtsB